MASYQGAQIGDIALLGAVAGGLYFLYKTISPITNPVGDIVETGSSVVKSISGAVRAPFDAFANLFDGNPAGVSYAPLPSPFLQNQNSFLNKFNTPTSAGTDSNTAPYPVQTLINGQIKYSDGSVRGNPIVPSSAISTGDKVQLTTTISAPAKSVAEGKVSLVKATGTEAKSGPSLQQYIAQNKSRIANLKSLRVR